MRHKNLSKQEQDTKTDINCESNDFTSKILQSKQVPDSYYTYCVYIIVV